MNASTECVLCGGPCREFLRRDGVPVQQNFLFRTQEDAVNAARGDLQFVVCGRCGFVFNAAFDAARVPYGAEYENAQTCSPAFRVYLDGVIRHIIELAGSRSGHIVEVGCGQADLLRRLLSEPGSMHTATGFDPSYRGPDSDLDGRLRVERRYFGPESAVRADTVVCRHVIEHVSRPLELLRQIAAAMEGSPGARFFCETPCVEWIFRNDVFWDFFYEHCSLFTAGSIRTALELSGFAVERVRHAFSGQYLWADAAAAPARAPRLDPGGIPDLALAFGEREKELKSKWSGSLEALAGKGKIAVWGAGAKGVTFANLIDPRRRHLECVVDVNPAKQGTFVAGTGHPIVDPRQLPKLGVSTAIVMNPNYIAENRRLTQEAGFELELIPANE